jgi:xanthosine utilization system XapX-like protein
LGLNLPIAWGSLLLVGMGLLQLGINAQPFRVILGLLTIMSGFEILYAAVESSTLVAALLSAVNLGLALTGAFFLNMPQEEKP